MANNGDTGLSMAEIKASAFVESELKARRLTFEQAHVLAKIIVWTTDSEDFSEILVKLLSQD